MIKTIFFLRPKKPFDWIEKEDSTWTWDKNHLTYVSQPTEPDQLTSYEQPLN